ncbi:MAG: LCP family protein [Candidatus Gracilibacteria bacterium]
MDFKSKKIRDHREPKKHTNKDHAHHVTIGLGVGIIVLLLFGIFMLIKSLDFSNIIFSFGKNLRTDNEGHTNILLAGTGGEGHDGGDLTDTIIVASIDYNNKLVSMLSIPRDLYVKSTKLDAGERINQIYYLGKHKFNSKAGMEDLKDIASGISGMQIDYYAKVDFDGFVKIVNSLGGIDLNVEKDIYDPYYPLGETTRYQTFSIKAGYQHLDGETALKFARSRKTTSDFDRARRQQQLLNAVKEKALSLNILTDPGKIQALYNSLQNSIETNFTVEEIIELAKTAKDFGKESLISNVLSDNPYQCGGFLYTPAREFFGGAFVLLPAGKNYESVHEMTDMIFHHAPVVKAEPAIQILNGTKTGNLAGEVKEYLNRLCFNIVYTGNASTKDVTSTKIYYQPGVKGEKPAILELVKKYLPYPEVPGIPAEYLDSEKKTGTQIVVELGSDYLQNRLKDPFDILPYINAPKTTTQEATSQSQQ